jgi:hypothetical protein
MSAWARTVRRCGRRSQYTHTHTKLVAARIAAVAARRAAVRRVVSTPSFALVVRVGKLPVRLNSSIKDMLWASIVWIKHIFVLVHIIHLRIDR